MVARRVWRSGDTNLFASSARGVGRLARIGEELRELDLADCALRKVLFWGAYLVVQFAVEGAFAASALDATQGEAHDLRLGLNEPKGLFQGTRR